MSFDQQSIKFVKRAQNQSFNFENKQISLPKLKNISAFDIQTQSSQNQILKRKEIRDRARSILHGPVVSPQITTIKPVKQIEMFKKGPIVFRAPEKQELRMPPVEPAQLVIDLNQKPRYETKQLLELYRTKAMQESEQYLNTLNKQIDEQEKLQNPNIKSFYIRKHMEQELLNSLKEAQLCEEIVMLVHNTKEYASKVKLTQVYTKQSEHSQELQLKLQFERAQRKLIEAQQSQMLVQAKRTLNTSENSQ
ncbi:Hypothetical_protein [Hexamita inflata]|uniref:Hypothetical_protein n=1 Tax=Hexamita inflata TaxID=28002 RepID=A0AA86NHW1_9EUKA|nr:Hypothetical protein HINF_LOCUS7387 [Hexamita inflata]